MVALRLTALALCAASFDALLIGPPPRLRRSPNAAITRPLARLPPLWSSRNRNCRSRLPSAPDGFEDAPTSEVAAEQGGAFLTMEEIAALRDQMGGSATDDSESGDPDDGAVADEEEEEEEEESFARQGFEQLTRAELVELCRAADLKVSPKRARSVRRRVF